MTAIHIKGHWFYNATKLTFKMFYDSFIHHIIQVCAGGGEVLSIHIQKATLIGV